ncbi:MAG: EamA family transporter [Gammaproteobacteria bacterium]|nr:MAG: EamA family transporter [Gammaproteobacteria bacterium]
MTPSDHDHVLRGTLIGGVAILMWASLAVLTAWSGDVPPFQMVAIAFTVAFLIAMARWRLAGQHIATRLRQPPAAWALGVSGLFGYHFLIFYALKNAPAVEANLVNYLWPLLIVLFSALLPGERLRWRHVAGAALGLAGTAVLLGGSLIFRSEHLGGYLAALLAAITWARYAVLKRRFAHVPTDAVGGFCLVGAALAMLCHLLFETTIWPQDGGEWLAVLALGLGPAGGAFFFWDYGVKHGNLRTLGAWSYTIPLMSTGLLLVAGIGTLTARIAVACGLIVGGALLATDRRRRR